MGFSSGGTERTGKYPAFKGELYTIYLLKDYQRKGLGKMLITPFVKYLLENDMNTMTVSVLAENNARYFYEALGGRQIDTVQIQIGGKTLAEIVYGFQDISRIDL